MGVGVSVGVGSSVGVGVSVGVSVGVVVSVGVGVFVGVSVGFVELLSEHPARDVVPVIAARDAPDISSMSRLVYPESSTTVCCHQQVAIVILFLLNFWVLFLSRSREEGEVYVYPALYFSSLILFSRSM